MSRKKIFAERRRREAKERKEFNRDQFIRKLLKRKGLPVWCPNPDLECFRGHNVFVDRIFKVQDCAVGVVLGCNACKNAPKAFERISQGQKTDLGFECRHSTEPKLWIMQPHEIIPKPGIYSVKRSKPLYDSHGHVIAAGSLDEIVLPRTRGRPSRIARNAPPAPPPQIILPVHARITTVDSTVQINVQIPISWLSSLHNHLPDLLGQVLANMPPGASEVNELMAAYSEQRLSITPTPGGFELKILEGPL